jgi:hypothetical protein
MSKSKISVVKNTENIYKIALTVDGVLTNHSLITAAELRTLEGVTIASSTAIPSVYDFTNAGYIAVKLGLITAAAGTYTCRLITKDAIHTTGISWDTDIILTILP